MTKKLRELRESGRGRDGGWKRGSRARSRPAGGREGSGHAEEDDLLAGGERVDGDLLQLVALVEPPELAVGEGVADGDRSHGRAGGMGCRRGLGCGAVAEWLRVGGQQMMALASPHSPALPGVFVGGARGPRVNALIWGNLMRSAKRAGRVRANWIFFPPNFFIRRVVRQRQAAG